MENINKELNKVYLSSFNGCLCNYRDTVKADNVDVSQIFAGQDCFASNHQEDISREADAQAINELTESAQEIVVTYHDRSSGLPEEDVVYRKVDGKWTKESTYYDYDE